MPSAIRDAEGAATSSPRDASLFAKVVRQGNKFDGNTDKMWKFCILDNSVPVGYILHDVATEMAWPVDSFNVIIENRSIHLNPALTPADDAVEVCRQRFVELCEMNRSKFRGCFDKWLTANQQSYAAIRWLDNPEAMFRVPAPLRGILGVATAGVHLNVYTIASHQKYMWVSQRSLKTSYPAMLDQIVAGGMDPEDGYDPWKALEHEAREEADLTVDVHTKNVTQNDQKIGTVSGPFRISFYDKKDRFAGMEQGHIEPGVRFVFDMEVKPSFVPTPGTDSAIGGFFLKSIDEIKRDLIGGKWKPNSALATLDFLTRMEYIVDDGNGDMDELRSSLNRELPMATN